MRLRNILIKRKQRLADRRLLSDWTTGWSARDWADLPPHHPRREEDATR
jgi:hypothetical protein